jgi:hypothetical protein
MIQFDMGSQQIESDAPFETPWQFISTKAIYVTTSIREK